MLDSVDSSFIEEVKLLEVGLVVWRRRIKWVVIFNHFLALSIDLRMVSLVRRLQPVAPRLPGQAGLLSLLSAHLFFLCIQVTYFLDVACSTLNPSIN